MATDITSLHDAYDHLPVETTTSGYSDPAGTAFLWFGWTIAFAFWVASMSEFFGILRAIAAGGPGSIRGGIDAGGTGYLLMEVIGGMIVLGAALAWGMARWATRDRRRDPITEAATAELYDSVERTGGDDMVDRSPEGRLSDDGYRPA